MFIAQKLRKKSIAEYLLYMWQIEDIIRAMGCSLPLIKKVYISKFSDYTQEQIDDETDWFGNLIRMMNEEGKRDGGHLNINNIVLEDLVDLHNRLMQSDKFVFYSSQYYKVLPYIVELRAKNKRADNYNASQTAVVTQYEKGEIETCFDALYGKMLLDLQKKTVTPETANALKEISNFVGLLSDYYLKNETEGLKFDDDENA